MDEINNEFNVNQQGVYNQPPQQDINSQYDYTQRINNNNQPKNNSKTCFIVGCLVAVFFIVLIVIAIIAVFFMLGKEKEFITADQFDMYMKNQDYVILDATNQFSYVDYIEKVSLAKDFKDDYQIEFYEFDSDAQAERFYVTNKGNFELYEDEAKLRSNSSGKNHNKYSLTTTSSHKVISQIGNTAIFVDVDKDNKEEVETHLKELGY